MDAMEQALNNANRVIAHLFNKGYGDYTRHLIQIAEDLYYNGLWGGNPDATASLYDPSLKDLIIYQEDEYDQHLDDDEKPDWDSMICYVDGYIFFA